MHVPFDLSLGVHAELGSKTYMAAAVQRNWVDHKLLPCFGCMVEP